MIFSSAVTDNWTAAYAAAEHGMFGLLRTTLALMVMAYHLLVGIFPLGAYAVFGFYVISGYLMTLVMHRQYGHDGLGRMAFAANRFLRLYPMYWAAGLASVLLILSIGGGAVHDYHHSIYLPVSADALLQNVLMVFPAWHPGDINPRLVPPTWALTVEMCFYVLICMGISKTLVRTRVWFVLSVGYVVFSYQAGWPMADRYSTILAASLPFSVGALVYFYATDVAALGRRVGRMPSARWLFLLMLANCAAAVVLWGGSGWVAREVGFYVNVLIFAVLVYAIAVGDEIFPLSRWLDKAIGDHSYPIYLLHQQVGVVASMLVFGVPAHEFSARGLGGLMLAVLIIVPVSFVLIRFIDTPVQRVRSRIKHGIHTAANESGLRVDGVQTEKIDSKGML